MTAPALTLVVVATSGEATHPEVLARLAAPLAAGELEVVEVRAAGADGRRPPVDPRLRVVEAEAGSSVPKLRALGLRTARTPWVALTEAFCVPASSWHAALSEAVAGRRGVAVGGPVDRRAGGPTAWASTLREYGPFLPGRHAGPAPDLAGVNVAYDLERLSAVGCDQPEEVFEFELHRRLLAAGETLWYQPEALVWDDSRPRLRRAVGQQLRFGRLHGGRRGAELRPAQRWARAAAAPAVPAVLLTRSLRAARAAGRSRKATLAIGALLLLHLAWALGEGWGYLSGAGDTEDLWR